MGEDRRERFMLVATVKDEGPNVLEWVAWHRLVGFDDIVIYQNSSFDTTEQTLMILHRLGIIQYFNNDTRKPGLAVAFQNRAYKRAARLPAYVAADWCMALDGDEFLVVNANGGTVRDLVAAVGPADEIRLNWRLFGSNRQVALSHALVSERYTMGVRPRLVSRQPVPVKTLFRTAAFGRPGIHRPRLIQKDPIIARTGSGRPVEEVTVRSFQVTDPEPYLYGQVNHYMVRDAESFLVKSARGSSSHPERDIALTYWRKRDINLAEDRGLADNADRIRAEMQRLDDLSSGRLMRLRTRALRQWRIRVGQILELAEGQALFQGLIGKPPGAPDQDPGQDPDA